MTVLGFTRRLIFGAAVFAPTMALAQPPSPPDDGPRPPRGGRVGPGEDRPAPPIIAALDTNRDGKLSADEIANASTALKTLDRNHDGILDRSELAPRGGPPGGPGGPGRGGRGGPDGPPPGEPFGGPPTGPPGGGRPDAGGRPEIGRVFPPFVRDELDLTEAQADKIAALEKEVKSKIESILTPAQLRQVREGLERGPGGRGPGGRRPGGPPGGEDDETPVRPERPRRP